MNFGTNIASSLVDEIVDNPGVYRITDLLLKQIQIIRTYREHICLLNGVDNINKFGIYILLGHNDVGQLVVYVGKSIDVLNRVNEHIKDPNKNFFTEVFLITATDNDSFGDSQIAYLENFIYNRFVLSPNIVIANDVVPSKGALQGIMAKVCATYGEAIINMISQFSSGRFLTTKYGSSDASVFTFRGVKGCKIKATYKNGQLIVHKDSEVSKTVINTAPAYVKRERESLIELGLLIEFKDSLILKDDYVFNSVNTATNTLVGSSVTRPAEQWRNSDGITLKEYIDNGSSSK